MVWSYRPGVSNEDQLNNLENDLGLDNLRDAEIKDISGTFYLYIYRNSKTFRVALTEVV